MDALSVAAARLNWAAQLARTMKGNEMKPEPEKPLEPLRRAINTEALRRDVPVREVMRELMESYPTLAKESRKRAEAELIHLIGFEGCDPRLLETAHPAPDEHSALTSCKKPYLRVRGDTFAVLLRGTSIHAEVTCEECLERVEHRAHSYIGPGYLPEAWSAKRECVVSDLGEIVALVPANMDANAEELARFPDMRNVLVYLVGGDVDSARQLAQEILESFPKFLGRQRNRRSETTAEHFAEEANEARRTFFARRPGEPVAPRGVFKGPQEEADPSWFAKKPAAPAPPAHGRGGSLFQRLGKRLRKIPPPP
jgi:hypothetical protein